MNTTNLTSIYDNETFISSSEWANPCPRQRNITRPLLFVHNYALFFFGSIFNFLAFAILMQRSLRCHSTFAYLAFLSLSNGLLSLVHCSKWMVKYYFNFLFENYLITCRLHRFLSDFLTHFSLFTLICVNIDRARTVTKNRPNTKYSKSKFRIVLIKECLVASILCAFHFHWIIKYGYHGNDSHPFFLSKAISRISPMPDKSSFFVDNWDEQREVTICGFDENQATSIYNYFLTTIYPPFELVVFFCLPLIINIVCTILIVRSLSIRMRTAKQFQPKQVNVKESISKKSSAGFLSYFLPKTTSQSNIHSCLGFHIQCRRHTRIRLKMTRNKRNLIEYDEENQSIEQQKSSQSIDNQSQFIAKTTSDILNKKHRTRRTRDIHLSAMLISLNILYLLLNLPFNLHQTFVKHFHKINSDPCDIMFISLLLDSLQQTFFMTNFFLYVLTNRRFREEFYNTIIGILSHCKRKSSVKVVQKQSSKYYSRTSSCNQSASLIQLNQNNDNNLMIPTSSNQNPDSFVSDFEITETLAIQQQQTSITGNENNKLLSKLVMFKDISND